MLVKLGLLWLACFVRKPQKRIQSDVCMGNITLACIAAMETLRAERRIVGWQLQESNLGKKGGDLLLDSERIYLEEMATC